MAMDHENGVCADTAAALAECGKTAKRSLLVSLSVSLIPIFLIYDEFGGSAVAEVRSKYSEAVDTLEAVMRVGDSVLAEPASLRSYSEFMRPFVAIASSAEQAIVGVDSNDPRWLSLDPEQRDLARSTSDSVTWLENRVTWLQGTNLRDIHIENFKDYSEWVIFPEPRIDNATAVKSLLADEYVAISLGQNLKKRLDWPPSFYFHDFVAARDYDKILSAISLVRDNMDMNQITLQIDRLDQLCTDNAIEPTDCTSNGLARIFDNEPNRLIPDEGEKIIVDFLPIGIDRLLILWLSPPLILTSFLWFAANIGYGRRLANTLPSFPTKSFPISLLSGWKYDDRHPSGKSTTRDPFFQMETTILTGLVKGSFTLPSISLTLLLYFGWTSNWSPWWIAGSAAILCLTLISLGGLLLPRTRKR